jgi:hypothetical protein
VREVLGRAGVESHQPLDVAGKDDPRDDRCLQDHQHEGRIELLGDLAGGLTVAQALEVRCVGLVGDLVEILVDALADEEPLEVELAVADLEVAGLGELLLLRVPAVDDRPISLEELACSRSPSRGSSSGSVS